MDSMLTEKLLEDGFQVMYLNLQFNEKDLPAHDHIVLIRIVPGPEYSTDWCWNL